MMHTNVTEHFRSGVNKAADKMANEVLTNKTHNEFSDVLLGIGCFEVIPSLQVKDGSQPYEIPSEEKRGIHTTDTPKRSVKEMTKGAKNNPTRHQ